MGIDNLQIKDIPYKERPREKLISVGPEYLNNEELLAVIFSKGTKKEGVLRMAKRLTESYGILSFNLGTRDVKKLKELLELPLIHACQLVAFLELGERIFSKRDEIVIRSPQDAYNYLAGMSNLKREHLRGLYLNARNRILKDEILSIGTITSSISTPREIFAPALEISSVALILAHNHPSGDPTPSKEDIEFTRRHRVYKKNRESRRYPGNLSARSHYYWTWKIR